MPTSRTAWSACASAATATRHTTGDNAKPMAAAAHTRSGTPRRRTTSTVMPAAVAIRMADRRLMTNAGDPRGARTIDASQPTTTYAGEPVGCSVPRIGRTVCASAVSQAPSPGSSVER